MHGEILGFLGDRVMTEERPAGIEFVTFDTRLAEAAAKEGCKLLPG